MKIKRIALAKKMVGVVDLLKLVDAYNTGDVGQWVALGFLTPEERAEWDTLSKVEGAMYKAGRDAEEAVQRPEIPLDKYPKEYREIVARLNALKPDVDTIKKVDEAIRGLTSARGNQYSDGSSKGSRLGVSDIADLALVALRDAPNDDDKEYWNLVAAEERRTRPETSVVRRIRHGYFEEYNRAKSAANEAAVAKFKAEHRDLLNRKRALEILVDTRRDAKIAELGKAIRTTLEKALA